MFEGGVCQYKLLPFKHFSQLGFPVNWVKSKLMPMERISFLGMELDSVSQTAHLTQELAQSVLNCLKTLSGRTAVPLKLIQRLLGHMSAAAAIFPLGCSVWDHLRTGSMAESRGGCGVQCCIHRVQITTACRRTFSLWTDPLFLRARVAPGAGIQVWCVIHGCLSHRLRSHVQRARSSGVWTGPNCKIALYFCKILR